MATEPVRNERDHAVATVTINAPERRNALTVAVKEALRDSLRAVADDRGVRAVILTGAGSAFCVGQDLAEHAAALAADPETAFATLDRHYAPIVTLLAGMPKPVVAAVSGACVGAGLALALACDLRVFADTATLGTAFSGVGLTCDSGLSLTLSQAVGAARARELVLLGASFTPADAVSWGMAGRIVPAAQVGTVAAELAHRLADGPTLAYAETKRLLATAATRTWADALAAEREAQARCGHTLDHREAVQAFLRRERPTFLGR